VILHAPKTCDIVGRDKEATTILCEYVERIRHESDERLSAIEEVCFFLALAFSISNAISCRLETYNTFNHPVLSASGNTTIVNSPQFGQIVNGGAPRNVQLGLPILFQGVQCYGEILARPRWPSHLHRSVTLAPR
jgi:hypothetical protein